VKTAQQTTLFIVRIAESEKIKKIFAFNVDIFKKSAETQK